MKQIYIYGIMLFLMLGIASATTVDCGPDSWYNVVSKHCEASEIQPNFDELEQDLEQYADQGDEKTLQQAKKFTKKKVNNLETTIQNNEALWLMDGGTSWLNVKKRLYGIYFDFLQTQFAPITIMNDVQQSKKSAERFEAVNYWTAQGYNPVYWKGQNLYGIDKKGNTHKLKPN